MGLTKACRFEESRGPAASADIEPAGAGGIGHVGNILAGQPEPEIVLGQEHLVELLEDLGFIGLHPGNLGCRETGKNDIAGDLAKARIGIQRGGLFVGSCIVPEHAGPKRLAGLVQKRRAMHLTGKPDAAHGGERLAVIRFQGEQSRLASLDPIGGGLFGPAGGRARDIEVRARRGDDPLVIVEQQGLQGRGAEIKSEIHGVACLRRSFGPSFQCAIAPGPGSAPGGHLPRMIIPRTSSLVTSSVLAVPTMRPFFITATRSASSKTSSMS